jgi:hypothetical protein
MNTESWAAPPRIDDQPGLEQCLAFWKEVLGLQPWAIQIMFDRAENLGGTLAAHIDYAPAKESGVLRLRDPRDWYGFAWKQDVEVSIVHELLHLIFWPFDHHERTALAEVHEEQIVERLARSLVSLRRRGSIPLMSPVLPNLIREVGADRENSHA